MLTAQQTIFKHSLKNEKNLCEFQLQFQGFFTNTAILFGKCKLQTKLWICPFGIQPSFVNI